MRLLLLLLLARRILQNLRPCWFEVGVSYFSSAPYNLVGRPVEKRSCALN